jgi:hypothetical protein
MVIVMTTRTVPRSSPVTPRRDLRLLPGWLVRVAWAVHRAAWVAAGRLPDPRGATAEHPDLRQLGTNERRTGHSRRAIPGYVDYGSDAPLVAMSGPADPTPRWLPDLHGYTLMAWR